MGEPGRRAAAIDAALLAAVVADLARARGRLLGAAEALEGWPGLVRPGAAAAAMREAERLVARAAEGLMRWAEAEAEEGEGGPRATEAPVAGAAGEGRGRGGR